VSRSAGYTPMETHFWQDPGMYFGRSWLHIRL